MNEFIDLVRKKCYGKIRLGEFVKNRIFPGKKKHKYHQVYPSITDSTEAQNALLRIVVQNRVFHETHPTLLNRANYRQYRGPPFCTGLLGRHLPCGTFTDNPQNVCEDYGPRIVTVFFRDR